MLKSKITPLILTSIIAASASAAESELTYTYASAGYVQTEILDEDFSGFGGNVSVAVSDDLFLVGTYLGLVSDNEFFGDELDLTQYSLGVGFHSPATKNIDVVASVSYLYGEAEYTGDSIDGNGYILSAGVRAKPTDILELVASINHESIDRDDTDRFDIGARLFATPAISFGISYSKYNTQEDFETYGVDARINF